MKGNGKRKKVTIVILALCLLTVVAGGICILNRDHLFGNPNVSSSAGSTKKIDNNGSATDGALQSKTQAEILKELQDKQINVTDKLSSNIFFSSGKAGTEGKWNVENVATNTVSIQCEVYLGDKLIAKSVPIKPNQHIDSIILSADVAPGQYVIIAYVNYYSLDTGDYLAKAGFKVSLTVQ